jgi:DNA-binding transcriptional regulator YdaS (Cro superfamily)
VLKVVEKAAEMAGGAAALARRLGRTRQALYQWKRVPPQHVLAIERATKGRVSRHDLRPDLYPRPRAPAESAEALRLLLWQAKAIDEIVRLARRSLPAKMAARIEELRRAAYEAEEGDKPFDLESLRWFLDFCLRWRPRALPHMGLTPDGCVGAYWQRGESRAFSIQFFPDGKTWAAVSAPEANGSWEMPAKDLLTSRSPVQIPEWVG